MMGLLLTFVAAYVQQAKIGLNPQYFNHNALYHLIQAVALGMFFLSARQLTKAAPAQSYLPRPRQSRIIVVRGPRCRWVTGAP